MQYYCAPMEGLTGAVFRRVHHQYFPGIDRYVTPFVAPTQNHCFTPRELRELLPEDHRDIPVVPQLLTKSATDFLWAAGELAQMGYQEVNLNLGCPSGTVVAKGKGAGLLAHPEELNRMLEEIFSVAPLRISLKTRLGLRTAAEFPTLLEIYNRYPISELILHPRVREDFYRGEVHMSSVKYACQMGKAPLCYNGDLTTPGQCTALARDFPGVGAIMLGRGLLADPALCTKLQGGEEADRETLRAFHNALYEGYCAAFGSRHSAMQRMKEFWSYLIVRFEGGEKAMKRLRKAAHHQEFERLAQDVLCHLPRKKEADSPGNGDV